MGKQGLTVMKDGTEEVISVTLEVTRYIPSPGKGRMYLTSNVAEWEDKQTGVSGRILIPVGSADVVIEIRRGEDLEQVRFRAQDMANLAIKVTGPLPEPSTAARCSCGRFGRVVDKAPPGESGDIVYCGVCMKKDEVG